MGASSGLQRLESQAAARANLGAPSRNGESAIKIRVIAADDFPLVREGIVRALNRDPAINVVGEANNGQEALELVAALQPDVLILDLIMPGLDGLGVLDALGKSHPEVRVLLMTASEQAGPLLGAFEAGAAGYLSKRATGEELRQAVITAHGGGSVIPPSLASHLLKEFSSSARGEQSAVRPLQGRELDVLRLVVQGKTDNEIGQELFISPRTVQNHLTRIREKTGLRRRSELTRWAVEHAIG
jgi:two-component system NarL family response regulator